MHIESYINSADKIWLEDVKYHTVMDDVFMEKTSFYDWGSVKCSMALVTQSNIFHQYERNEKCNIN